MTVRIKDKIHALLHIYKFGIKYVKILQEKVYLRLKTIKPRRYIKGLKFSTVGPKYYHKRLKALTRPKKQGKSH